MSLDVHQVIRELCRRDPRFAPPAYVFVLEALQFTTRDFTERRHITGQELLEGIRRYAREQFGGLARMVFHRWGIRSTMDFGEIVFLLVEAGLMSKTDSDRKEDFRGVYDFDAVFSEPGTARLGEEAPPGGE